VDFGPQLWHQLLSRTPDHRSWISQSGEAQNHMTGSAGHVTGEPLDTAGRRPALESLDLPHDIDTEAVVGLAVVIERLLGRGLIVFQYHRGVETRGDRSTVACRLR
jgi:hypothetical protein